MKNVCKLASLDILQNRYKRGDFLSWICDVCGYENVFDDNDQPTKCQCCFSDARPEQIIKAKRELEALHKERERQAKLEELRLKMIQKQKKMEKAIAKIFQSIKIASVSCAAMVGVCIIILVISVVQKDTKLSNIPDNSVIMLETHKVSEPFSMISSLSKDHLSNYISLMSENLKDTKNNEKQEYGKNLALLPQNIKENFIALNSNKKATSNNISLSFKNFGQHAPTSTANIQEGFKNIKNNLPVCWENASKNINNLAEKISAKFGRTK